MGIGFGSPEVVSLLWIYLLISLWNTDFVFSAILFRELGKTCAEYYTHHVQKVSKTVAQGDGSGVKCEHNVRRVDWREEG